MIISSGSPRPAPVEVSIFGSCITRDSFNSIFNPGYKDLYACSLHQNQMSMIALMSDPLEVAWQPTRTMSDYDRWNVETEFNHEFLDRVRDLQPAYLVLDFFGDVHFGVVRLDDGRYVTNNRWKVSHTDWYQEQQAAGTFTVVAHQDGADDYLELWAEAFDRFVTFVRTELPDTRLILHRGHNTNLLRLPDRPRPVRLQKNRKLARVNVPELNRMWARFDDYASRSVDAVIDLTDPGYATFDDHPWGGFYVHYTMDYYHRFLGELHKIVLGDTYGDQVARMVAEVQGAAEERAGIEIADRDQIIARQRERLDRAAARAAALERRTLRGTAKRIRNRFVNRADRPGGRG